jgi:hypothetical protein
LENYTIVFEGIRGISYRSDIALDDIFFVSGPCEGIALTTFADHNCSSPSDQGMTMFNVPIPLPYM